MMELQTSRLRLDSLQPEDAEALFDYRSDPQVARFQGWRPRSLAEATAFIERQAGASIDTPDSWIQRAIRLRDGGELIGDVGIHLPPDAAGSIEFGITVAPAFQSKGFASETLESLFGLIFGALGRHRVVASVDPRNMASMAMLRAVGMRQEAHHLESLWLQGEWVDDVVFALLTREWQDRSANTGPVGARSR
jgi:RimJ/RimL family protein N-acetyltransferase